MGSDTLHARPRNWQSQPISCCLATITLAASHEAARADQPPASSMNGDDRPPFWIGENLASCCLQKGPRQHAGGTRTAIEPRGSQHTTCFWRLAPGSSLPASPHPVEAALCCAPVRPLPGTLNYASDLGSTATDLDRTGTDAYILLRMSAFLASYSDWVISPASSMPLSFLRVARGSSAAGACGA